MLYSFNQALFLKHLELFLVPITSSTLIKFLDPPKINDKVSTDFNGARILPCGCRRAQAAVVNDSVLGKKRVSFETASQHVTKLNGEG